ncbi:MAG: hypothetical protein NTX72_01195 [Candidatus Uhrbacteria bacterium]|nr:hypothetical protein [Candidatus Uhrbacteria bacterium]
MDFKYTFDGQLTGWRWKLVLIAIFAIFVYEATGQSPALAFLAVVIPGVILFSRISFKAKSDLGVIDIRPDTPTKFRLHLPEELSVSIRASAFVEPDPRQDRIDELESELEDADSELEDADSEWEDAKSELEDAESEVRDAQDELRRVEEERGSHLVNVSEYASKRAEAQAKKDRIEAELAKAREPNAENTTIT